MDLLKDNPKKLYNKYALSLFGASCFPCIYGIVDIAMVGQYHGPLGTAAVSVVTPLFTIAYGLGFLTGAGGSVLYGICKGRNDKSDPNVFFTSAVMLTLALSAVLICLLLFAEEPILRLCGADDTLLPMAMSYNSVLKYTLPAIIFGQMLSMFLLIDGSPRLVTASVLIGGVFNIFGDYFFVFVRDMGIRGAGLATAMGGCITCAVIICHFFMKHNTLRITRIPLAVKRFPQVIKIGFPSFIADFSAGMITIMMNNHIMKFFGTDALSVFGVIINISMFTQCCGYTVGQAVQPLISVNFGAKQYPRIRQFVKYGAIGAALFGIGCMAVNALIPNQIVHAFMAPTESVLAIAPHIMRTYGLAYLFLPFNILAIYVFQSTLHTAESFVVSLGRGFVLSGIFIALFPLIAPGALWFAVPVSELAICAYGAIMILKHIKRFPEEGVLQ